MEPIDTQDTILGYYGQCYGERHRGIRRTCFVGTNDVQELYEATITDPDNTYLGVTRQELIRKLQEKYPDIEPGYGRLYIILSSAYVADEPGITTTNITEIENILKKHGKMPLHASLGNIKLPPHIIISPSRFIRYDEKAAKRKLARKKKKEDMVS